MRLSFLYHGFGVQRVGYCGIACKGWPCRTHDVIRSSGNESILHVTCFSFESSRFSASFIPIASTNDRLLCDFYTSSSFIQLS